MINTTEMFACYRFERLSRTVTATKRASLILSFWDTGAMWMDAGGSRPSLDCSVQSCSPYTHILMHLPRYRALPFQPLRVQLCCLAFSSWQQLEYTWWQLPLRLFLLHSSHVRRVTMELQTSLKGLSYTSTSPRRGPLLSWVIELVLLLKSHLGTLPHISDCVAYWVRQNPGCDNEHLVIVRYFCGLKNQCQLVTEKTEGPI